LKNRIRDRAEISENELSARIESVKMERKYKEKADFVIKNIEN
jgi:guanylate kinase